jgi:cell wall-associated NlpC family hydrolase
LRVRALSAVLSFTIVSVVAALMAAVPALASATSAIAVAGGASATPTKASTTPTPTSTSSSGGASSTGSTTAPKKPIYTSPITAKSPNVTYTGPVYEKTATGQIVPYQPPVTPGQTGSPTGGSAVAVTATTKPDLLVPGALARYVNGLAAAPESAPAAVQEIVWAGNQLIGLPYIYGGGHASFISPGYDCSGTVSFALHGASLLQTPEDSSEFEVWGSHGVGRWVTIFANPGHAYMTVAGLRLDTSAADDPTNEQGPRWRPLRPENTGYVVRHPLGL